MKILQVIPVFYPALAFGGPVRVVYNISKELAKRDHDVTVYTTNAYDFKSNFKFGCSEHSLDGFKIHYFENLFRFDGVYISPTMISALRKDIEDFDAVHLHSWRQPHDIFLHNFAKKSNVPYILQAHGSLPRTMRKQKLKWIFDLFFGYRLLKDSSKVIAVTQMEAEQYRVMGVSGEKIGIIPNGIDQFEFEDLPRRGIFRKKHGIDNGEKLILYMGRIHKVKGIDILINAFTQISKEQDNAKLAIVGPDDGYLSVCKELATRLNVKDKILFTGPIYGRAKLEAYVDADVCAVPSKYEIFGMTILEAYACARPVVATEVSGAAKDVIINGRTGFLTQPGNVPQLARAIKRLLDNEAESKKMGIEGRKRIMKIFSIQRAVAKLENVYKEICDEAC